MESCCCSIEGWFIWIPSLDTVTEDTSEDDDGDDVMGNDVIIDDVMADDVMADDVIADDAIIDDVIADDVTADDERGATGTVNELSAVETGCSCLTSVAGERITW